MSEVICYKLRAFLEVPERYTSGLEVTVEIWEGVGTAVNDVIQDAVRYAVSGMTQSVSLNARFAVETVEYVKDIVG